MILNRLKNIFKNLSLKINNDNISNNITNSHNIINEKIIINNLNMKGYTYDIICFDGKKEHIINCDVQENDDEFIVYRNEKTELIGNLFNEIVYLKFIELDSKKESLINYPKINYGNGLKYFNVYK
jgi:hypothetical protein